MLSDTLQRLVVVIGDLVGSREAPDRADLQEQLRLAMTLGTMTWKPREPLTPTVGDELQGVFDDIHTALDATLFVRASLPPPYDVRFGIGVGAVTWVEDEPHGGFRRQDGPAWWIARNAIDHVARSGTSRGVPRSLRTWVAEVPVDRDPPGLPDVETGQEPRICALNAYLAVRDHLVTAMDARDRRILQHLLVGGQVTDIAEREGVTPSAISQRIQRSGAAEIMYARQQTMWGFFARSDRP